MQHSLCARCGVVFLLLLLGLFQSPFVAQADVPAAAPLTCDKIFDVVFLIDGSNSIVGENFISELKFVYNTTNKFANTTAQARMSLFQYSSQPRQEIAFTNINTALLPSICPNTNTVTFENPQCELCYVCGARLNDTGVGFEREHQSYCALEGDLTCCENNTACCCWEDGACQVPQALDTTSLTQGLIAAQNHVTAHVRVTASQFMIILTDTLNTASDMRTSLALTDEMKRNGTVVVAVGVGASLNATFLAAMASSQQTIHTVSNYNQVTNLVLNITSVVCQMAVPASASSSLSLTPTSSLSSSRSSSGSPSRSLSPSRSPSPSVSATVTPSTSHTPSPSASVSASVSSSWSQSVSASELAAVSASATVSASVTANTQSDASGGGSSSNNGVAVGAGVGGGAAALGALAALGYAFKKGKLSFPSSSSQAKIPTSNLPIRDPIAESENMVVNPMIRANEQRLQKRVSELEAIIANDGKAVDVPVSELPTVSE